MTTLMNLTDVKASADAVLSLKRKLKDEGECNGDNGDNTNEAVTNSEDGAIDGNGNSNSNDSTTISRPLKKANLSKGREVRLEQNRKAARESRRRKKVMIEELQRSVIFFSRANGALKQQNDDLGRLLMKAQTQVTAIESQKQSEATAQKQLQLQQEQQLQQERQRQHLQIQQAHEAQLAQDAVAAVAAASAATTTKASESTAATTTNQQETAPPADQSEEQAQAQTVATQAMLQTQGFPSAAARSAAQTLNGVPAAQGPAQGAQHSQTLPQMQPGATMQAMANFQQAAAAAMQAAVQGMQGVPVAAAAPVPPQPTPVANPAMPNFNDTMTAIAMQAAGQQFFQGNPFVGPMMAWQHQQHIPQQGGALNAGAPPQTN